MASSTSRPNSSSTVDVGTTSVAHEVIPLAQALRAQLIQSS